MGYILGRFGKLQRNCTKGANHFVCVHLSSSTSKYGGLQGRGRRPYFYTVEIHYLEFNLATQYCAKCALCGGNEKAKSKNSQHEGKPVKKSSRD